MDQSALRQFARRDWSAAASAKLDYWAEQYRQRGSTAARHASTLLLDHARRVQPDYPTTVDRARDLAHHIDLCGRLDRAARAFARR